MSVVRAVRVKELAANNVVRKFLEEPGREEVEGSRKIFSTHRK